MIKMKKTELDFYRHFVDMAGSIDAAVDRWREFATSLETPDSQDQRFFGLGLLAFMLLDGPRTEVDIVDEAIRCGISRASLDDMADAIGIERGEFNSLGTILWRLPRSE